MKTATTESVACSGDNLPVAGQHEGAPDERLVHREQRVIGKVGPQLAVAYATGDDRTHRCDRAVVGWMPRCSSSWPTTAAYSRDIAAEHRATIGQVAPAWLVGH
jgi:hypothetical protein